MLFCDKLVIIICMMTICILCCDAKTNHYFATKINDSLVCDEQQICINRLCYGDGHAPVYHLMGYMHVCTYVLG